MKKYVLFLAVLLFIICLTSCSPVVYEIGAAPEVYEILEKQVFFQHCQLTAGYEAARTVYSEKEYQVVLLREDDESESESAPKGNVFTKLIKSITGEKTYRIASIYTTSEGQDSLSAGGFAIAKPFGEVSTDALEAEISRLYMYPCVSFEEDMPYSAYSPTATGNLIAGEKVLAGPASVSFYELEQIPQGNIILPVQLGDVQYLAGDSDYPLYQSTFVRLRKYALPVENKVADTYAGGSIVRASDDAIRAMEERNATVKFSKKISKFYDDAVAKAEELFKGRVIPLLTKEPAIPKRFFVAGVGDLMVGRGVDWAMLNVKSASPVFNDTISILKNNSLTIANLEGPVTSRTTGAAKTYTFKFREDVLPYLKQAGINYLRLNNTHTFDYGEAGFLDTLTAISDAGFATSGAGKNAEEAARFYRTTINGYAVSILSLASSHIDPYNTNRNLSAATDKRAGILWETDAIYDKITEEKKTGAIVILAVHGGGEYQTTPSDAQRQFYQRLCDAGADLVLGSHPHVLQPVEWYKNSMIVWSLGNFIYPGMEEIAGATDSMIVRTGFVNGRLLYYEKYPVKLSGTTVRLVK